LVTGLASNNRIELEVFNHHVVLKTAMLVERLIGRRGIKLNLLAAKIDGSHDLSRVRHFAKTVKRPSEIEVRILALGNRQSVCRIRVNLRVHALKSAVHSGQPCVAVSVTQVVPRTVNRIASLK